tara:strand:+ start:152 stop:340 length:189 start_codon:yes stop_codon:yes gene_type:complete
MIWILVWLQLGTGKDLDYYHIGTFGDKDICIQEMSKASVLVTNKNSTIDCIPIKDVVQVNND